MNRRNFMSLLAALPFGALLRRAPVERGTVPVTVFVAEELETATTFYIDPPLPFEPVDIQDLQHSEYRDWPDFEIDAGEIPSPRRSTKYGYA